MKKNVLAFILVAVTIFSLVCCEKKKQKVVVNKDNAKIITYDYLLSLVGKTKLPKMTYAYSVDELVEVSDYKGLVTDESDSISVSDDEVAAFLAERDLEYAVREVRNEGKVEEGDILLVNIEGTQDGNPIGESLVNYEYKLGGNMIDELDERLVGVKVGETFDMPSSFSEDYSNKEYAGKNVNFTIKVVGVVTYTYPEKNEEFYEKMASDHDEKDMYTDSASFENYVRNKILNKKVDEYKANLYKEAWEKVLANTNIKEVPEFDYESAYSQMHDKLESMYISDGTGYENLDDYLKSLGYEKNSDELSKEAAQRYVKEKLCTLYIAKNEKITISEEEYNECVLKFAVSYGFADINAFLDAIGDARYTFLLERYYEVLYNKVRKLILE